jgi:tRNA 2-thiouridine synthesizing protein A
VSENLDLSGEVCPYTFLRAKLRLEELPLGARLTIIVDHPPAATNVPRSLVADGQAILEVRSDGNRTHIVVEKRAEHPLLGRAMKSE